MCQMPNNPGVKSTGDGMKFKAGDKVRCINSHEINNLIKGNIYTIEKIVCTSKKFYSIKNIRNNGLGGWCESRFELVSEEKMKFKKGDKLKCIQSSNTYSVDKVILDKIYTAQEDTFCDMVILVESNNGGWNVDQFLLNDRQYRKT